MNQWFFFIWNLESNTFPNSKKNNWEWRKIIENEKIVEIEENNRNWRKIIKNEKNNRIWGKIIENEIFLFLLNILNLEN